MVAEDGASRRALLRGAGQALVSAGALAALGGCGGQAPSGPQAVKQAARPVAHTDVEILTAALALERRTVAAYVAGIPLLPRSQVKGAKAFLSEELTHTGELISLIKAAGARRRTALRATTSGARPATPARCWRCCTRWSGCRSPAT